VSAVPRVGIYVHHHGGGHASRAGAIGAALRARGVEVTYLTSLDPARFDGEVVALPLDVDTSAAPAPGVDADASAAGPASCSLSRVGRDKEQLELPAELHYAPIGSPGLRRRMATIAAWIAAASPDLLLVDVSVEVALLARLCGTRFAYVRQTGRRDDPPHRLAYGWAAGLLAPYPEWLEAGWAPPELRARSGYVGAVTRFDGAPRPELTARPRRALVLGEGAERIGATLAAAAPNWDVLIATGHDTDRAGGVDPAPGGIDPGSVDLDLLASCAVVVSPAGANTVAEAAFAGCGLVCLPCERPFGEQVARGEDLERTGAAVVRAAPPERAEWPELLEEALDRRPALARWADGGGAGRAAAYLEGLATGSSTSAPASQRTSPAAASSSNQPEAGQVPQSSR
jgi:hypothetical protein